MNISADQLEVLCAIAEAAGREVMAVYGRDDCKIWTKEDETPLTEADLRANRVICEGLASAFPGVFILSEENAEKESALRAAPFFLVDPLDGTREFLKRNEEFTVNIALVSQGEAVAGVVLAPALGELFYAAPGLGAWKRNAGGITPLRVAPYDAAAPLRVIGSRTHAGEALTQWLGRLSAAHTFVAAGSSLKFCRIAEGLADLYPRLGPTSQWDTAAGQAVLEIAGGAVAAFDDGRPLRYGLERSLLNPFFIAVGDPCLLQLAEAK